jgi:hypothetical protein
MHIPAGIYSRRHTADTHFLAIDRLLFWGGNADAFAALLRDDK